MARVISIEIGQALTKICVMNYKEKNPHIYKNVTLETPQGVVSDGMLNPRESFVQLLRDTFAANKIKEKKLVFNVNSNKIASREVTIPYVKESRVGEVLRANAEEYFPVDLSDYRIAHTILGTIGENKEKSYKVLVMAVPEQILEGYFDVARMLNMEIAAIDYSGNSLLQAARRSCLEGTTMVAKIDGNSSTLMVIADGLMTSFRSIPYGVTEVVRAVQKGNNSSYLEAVEELQQHTYIGTTQWEGVLDLEAAEEMSGSLDMLVNGISRVVDFYNSKPENENIERILLTGFGGAFGGMSVLIQNRLGLSTSPLANVEGLVVPREFIDNTLGNYVGCIGAAMNPLDLVTVFKSKKGKASVQKSESIALPVAVGVACLVGAAVLAAVAYIPYQRAENENKELKRQEEQLRYAETLHNQYLATQDLWTQMRTMYALTVNDNDYLVAFVEELEEKMPSEIIVLSLAATDDGVALNMEVTSKEAAAKVLQQLRTFKSIAVVDTPVVTDVVEGGNVHRVSFTVSAAYTQQAQQQMEQEKEAALNTEETQE